MIAVLAPLAVAPAAAQDRQEFLGLTPGDVQINASGFGEVTLTDRAGGAGGTGDVITTVGAGVNASVDGARTNLVGTYRASYDQYLSQSDRSGYRQTLLASGNHEVIEEHLFFDASASMSTRFAGLGAASATERAGVGNQTQAISWSLGPTWRQRVGGSFANLSASYKLAGTAFFAASSGDVGESDRPDNGIIHNAAVALNSGSDFTRLRWSLGGSWQTQTGSGDDGDSGTRSVVASTEYRIDRRFGLLGSVGYDDVQLTDQAEGVISETDLSGVSWTVGLRFNPSPRTDMRAEYGQRYGDPYYSGTVNWRVTARTSVSASYQTDVQTLQEALLTGITPECLSAGLSAVGGEDVPITVECLLDLFNTGVLGPEGVNPSAPFTLVDGTARTQTFRAGINTRRERTNYSLNGTVTQREFTINGAEDTTYSVTGTASRRLDEQTTGSVSISYTASDNTVTGNEDAGLVTSDGSSSLRGRLSLSHQFADDLNGSVSYSHLRRDDNSSSGSTSENALVARIAVTF
ncbi:TIGR03016 family PEP-CTERM system-associated outer membrane protein [Caenispirillum salinarum]|uniref:TIGR03016 family PEP-CTERM system-associated outer membrane protein n=1 Tax=Caenispirillum salinarum TaxID=859058 RepID=UPI00384A823C